MAIRFYGGGDDVIPVMDIVILITRARSAEFELQFKSNDVLTRNFVHRV